MSKARTAWELAKKSPLHLKIVLFVSVLYLLSPIDLIPDFIPVIGQLDDILLITLVVRYASKYLGEEPQFQELVRGHTK